MAPPVTIIAEIGINFNGDFDTCIALIEAAAEAGCDLAKFQVFRADTLYPESAGKLAWKAPGGDYSYNIFTAVKQSELPRTWVAPLMAHCARRNIGFLASIFCEDDAHFLMKAGVEALKISSSSMRHLPLIDACASLNLPLIVSTGGSRLGEVEDVVRTVGKHHQKLTLLQCSLEYPTPPENCHLGVIPTLAAAFPEVIIGYSDHTITATAAPVQAVALGAQVIEKHITLDRQIPGPDHFFALEPADLRAMVTAVRDTETRMQAGQPPTVDAVLFGSSSKTVGKGERYLRDFVANQIFACRPIAKDEVIGQEDLVVLRRGTKAAGLAPKHLALFAQHTIHASRQIAAEEPVDWGCIL